MTTAFASRQFTKVAPYLYRTEGGVYYGKAKRKGKLHRQSLDTEDRATANRLLKDFLRGIEKQTKQVPDITFDDAAQRWLDSLYSLKAASKLRRETSLNVIKPAFRGRKLRTITKHDLTEWAAERSKEVSARTFNKDRECLVKLFAFAQDALHVIEENPAKALAKMKPKKAQVVPPTREQFAQLVEFIDHSKRQNKKDKSRNSGAFVRFLAYSGVRLDEARHVHWKHADFTKNSVRVTGGAEGTKNMSERTIPMFPALRSLLESFPVAERKANSPIFTLYTAKEVLKTASKEIGLPEGEHFGHNDMRHFFCSNAIELLIPDHVIAAWLGHRDGGVLVKTTYGHLRQSFGDAEALKMTFAS